MEEKGQPRLLGEALSAGSFCTAWKKLSGELVVFLGLKQASGERSRQRRGGVWGTGKRELDGRGEGLL